MGLSALISLLFKSAVVTRLAKLGGGTILGLGFLAWIVDHSGAGNGHAVVHISEPNVTVRAGPYVFHFVERPWQLIVCELPPGEHTLVMTREDRVLFEETFRIERGKSQVLTAFDPARLGQDQEGRSPDSLWSRPENPRGPGPSMTPDGSISTRDLSPLQDLPDPVR